MNSNQKSEKLYILMLSIHGLVRSEQLELGRDADTGGQIKYVVELAKKLSQDCSGDFYIKRESNR